MTGAYNSLHNERCVDLCVEIVVINFNVKVVFVHIGFRCNTFMRIKW